MIGYWLRHLCPPNRIIPILLLSAAVAEAVRYECAGNAVTFCVAWAYWFGLFIIIGHIKIV